MIQTLALLHAAYRELNARKLFWITLGLSGLVIAAMASIGLNEQGLSVLWWQFDLALLNTQFMPVDVFYKMIFAELVVPYWLAWIATILGLVSTSSIFPDMVSGGSIDVLLSKPISRSRLFLTRYLTGLLFMTLQVTVFATLAFLVIGLRGGAWEPWIFITIPLVVLFFSYLFCFCAVMGLLTRSTIASLLQTLLCWFFIFGVNSAEGITLAGSTATEISAEQSRSDLEEAEEAGDPIEVTGPLSERLDRDEENLATWRLTNSVFYGIKAALPKTDETIELLARLLRDNAGMEVEDDRESRGRLFGVSQRISMREFEKRIQSKRDARGYFWIIGTSLIFESLVLLFACWRFSRRDF
ncbi:MAG: ABC transporter permease [Planctomycetota bacterium]|nr:ABC transporter permease [Planctomycetota bacterium]